MSSGFYPLTPADATMLVVLAILVLFMQCGFALLESGTAAKRHSLNIIMKNLLDMCISTLAYWSVGWAFAFGSGNAFIGYSQFFLIDATPTQYALWFFEFSFASTSCTILSGAVAERIRVNAYVVYAVMMSLLVYPVVSHWIWSSQGWLNYTSPNRIFGCGLIDVAGGLVVHYLGGAASLLAVCMCGYRHQYSSSPAHPPRFERLLTGGWTTIDLPSSSPVDASTGVWILWFGWFAFNVSSALVTNGHASIGRVVVATTVCSSTSTIVSVYLSHVLQLLARRRDQATGRASRYSMWELDDALNGLLAGSVASTSGCAVVPVWAMVVIGAVSAFVMHGSSRLLLWLKIDDPVQAVPVHMFCGAWAVLSVALFADRALLAEVYGAQYADAHWGLFMGGGGWLLLSSIIGVVAVTAWACVTTGALFWLMAKYDKFRQYDVFFIRSPLGEETGFGQKLQVQELTQLAFPTVTSSHISPTSSLTGSLSPLAPQMPEMLRTDTATTEAATTAVDASWFRSMRERRRATRTPHTPRSTTTTPRVPWRTALAQRGFLARRGTGDGAGASGNQDTDGDRDDDGGGGDDDLRNDNDDDIRFEFAGAVLPTMPPPGATASTAATVPPGPAAAGGGAGAVGDDGATPLATSEPIIE